MPMLVGVKSCHPARNTIPHAVCIARGLLTDSCLLHFQSRLQSVRGGAATSCASAGKFDFTDVQFSGAWLEHARYDGLQDENLAEQKRTADISR